MRSFGRSATYLTDGRTEKVICSSHVASHLIKYEIALPPHLDAVSELGDHSRVEVLLHFDRFTALGD